MEHKKSTIITSFSLGFGFARENKEESRDDVVRKVQICKRRHILANQANAPRLSVNAFSGLGRELVQTSNMQALPSSLPPGSSIH